MKKIYLSFFLALVSTSIFSQVLFTFGNTPVTKDEFLRAYNKNKVPTEDKEKAIREYLDLYTKFKLKVKAAKDLRLDTLETLKSDLASFRNQIQDSYMTDDKGMASLVDEAFERSQKDLHVVHYFVGIDSRAGDSSLVLKAINEIYVQLQAGKNNYAEIAKDATNKYTPVNFDDLGFITAFTVPYQFENVIYGLKPGASTKPYRTKSGYHIFKLVEERKSIGRWKVAQILLAFPPGASSEQERIVKTNADELYNELAKGADFSEMAKKHSEDKLTYLTGGEMPEFGSGKYEASFENEVLKLKKDGDLSRPFSSPFGYHILKRISQTPTSTSKNDASYMYELKQKVMQNERANTARDIFVKTVVKQLGYKKSAAVKDADLFRYADSMNANTTIATIQKSPISSKIIFSFNNSPIKGSDWLNFVKDYKSSELYKNETGKDLLNKYIEIAALEIYKKHLEEYNPEFNYQLQEFKEGNMLFEIMERNVWSSAAADSVGLLNQYNKNKTKYLWPESANAIVFSCNNKVTAEEAATALKKGKHWKDITDSSYGKIQSDSGRYELAQIPIASGVSIKEGLISEPLVNITDGSASFVKVLKLYPANQQRSFDEARGLVINDYQMALEEKWIEALKKKYPVKVNEQVLMSMYK